MDLDTNEVKEYKVEVFVPLEAQEAVLAAIRSLHIGVIGNYYNCLSCTHVYSSWDADEAATPYLGERGETCQTEEIKIETRCPRERLRELVARIREAHPYEAVCINVMPLLLL